LLCEDERDFSLFDADLDADFGSDASGAGCAATAGAAGGTAPAEPSGDFADANLGAGAATPAEPSGDFAAANFGAGAIGVGAGAAVAGDECSRLLAGLPARVIDGADCDFDADADGADCDAAVPELDGARRLSSALPGEISFGSGYTDGGATSLMIGFAVPSFSALLGAITFGAG
jgi:hypothetical protein